MKLSHSIILALFVLGSAPAIYGQTQVTRTINPPVNSEGVDRNYCDVRDQRDYRSDRTPIVGTLRERIDLFNKEFDAQGTDVNQGNCLYGIHFLDRMTIVLREPIRIRGISNPLLNEAGEEDEEHYVGTYISGRRENGEALPVIIDARDVTSTAGQCAFMIDGGLESFQRIHDITILVANVSRGICDGEGRNLMNLPIPEDGSRGCNPGTLARNCDFRDVDVLLRAGRGGDGADLDNDGIPDNDEPRECRNTPAGQPVNELGCADSDGDGIFDNEDNCPTKSGSALLRGCPVIDVFQPKFPPNIFCRLTNSCGGGSGNGSDQDGDGISDSEDLCDRSSTNNQCDSRAGLADCFDDAEDNVCAGLSASEVFPCNQTDDGDGDGRGDACDVDIDGDTLNNSVDPDPFDRDADADGVDDNEDPCPLDANLEPNSLGQCAVEPYVPTDADTDGDGCTDAIEELIQTRPDLKDTDGDGFDDCTADCFPTDATRHLCGGGTVINDPDFDNDGICNEAISATDPVSGDPCTPNAGGNADNCPTVANPDQRDDNGNGVGDVCEIGTALDGDGDRLPDNLEDHAVFCSSSDLADTDGDGLNDFDEANGPTYQNGRGPCNPDVDEDGICDGNAAVTDICTAGPNGTGDNCPIVANENQADTDGDGIGDACQGDTDADGVPDNEDNCAFIFNPFQSDANEDGLGDDCDPNRDESGIDPGFGCQLMNAQTTSSGSGMLSLMLMGLPMLFLRMARRRS